MITFTKGYLLVTSQRATIILTVGIKVCFFSEKLKYPHIYKPRKQKPVEIPVLPPAAGLNQGVLGGFWRFRESEGFVGERDSGGTYGRVS